MQAFCIIHKKALLVARSWQRRFIEDKNDCACASFATQNIIGVVLTAAMPNKTPK